MAVVYSDLIISNSSNRVVLSWVQDEVQQGDKLATYTYPYTDGEYLESLGKSAKVFNITGRIDINTSYSNEKKLIKILEGADLITLELPQPINGKKKFTSLRLAGAYSINRSLQNKGLIDFIIQLKQTIDAPKYTQTITAGAFGGLVDNIFKKTSSIFENVFNAVNKGQEVFTNATEGVRQVSATMRRVSETVSGAVDGLNELNTTLSELTNSAETLIRTPATLAGKLSTTFQNFRTTFTNARDLFSTMRSLTSFSLDTGATNNSPTKQQQIQNAKAFEDNIKVNSLALQYQASVNIEYTTIEDLEDIQTQLQDSFNQLPEDIDIDLYRQIQDARSQAKSIFDGLTITLPRITTIQVNQQPLDLLCYSLYGNLDNLELLQDLNDIIDIERVSGNIKIISNG